MVELNKLADALLIFDFNELMVIFILGFVLENVFSSVIVGMVFREVFIIFEDKEFIINVEIKNKVLERLWKEFIILIKTLEIIVFIVDDILEKYKGVWFERNINKYLYLN